MIGRLPLENDGALLLWVVLKKQSTGRKEEDGKQDSLRA
jgi:hypothetical protein